MMIQNNQKPDILCFSSTDWDGVWGSRQQVMLRFARRGHRVLFIEQLAGLEHFIHYPELLQRRLQNWNKGLRFISPNLAIISPPPLFPGRYYSITINQMNNRIITLWSRRLLTKLGYESPVLWMYKPEHGLLIGHFKERLSIYHCIDEWTAGSAGRKRRIIENLEINLIKRVDLVFANSLPTYENKRRLNPNTFRVPSGVDIDQYAHVFDEALSIHPAIKAIPKPRIGYVGTINERLNYEYLEYLAKLRSSWSLILVGDTYPWTMSNPQLRRLRAYPNVYFLGKYPYSEIPALIKGMDVCLLPYISDERAFYRSPIKLYEYLAAGKPIVSTSHPEAQEFSRLIYLANSPDDFIKGIAEALSHNEPNLQLQRAEVAKNNSWDARVSEMERIIWEKLETM